MPNYMMFWLQYQEQPDPVTAARESWKDMRGPVSIAAVFYVSDTETGEAWKVNLGGRMPGVEPQITPMGSGFRRALSALAAANEDD